MGNVLMRKYSEIYAKPVAMNMVEENGKLWMALLDRNGICEVDIKEKRARICKVFEEELLEGEYLYCNVAKIENCLIFSPGAAKKIAIYDLASDSIRYLSLKPVNSNCKEDQRESKFWNIICHGTNAFLLGYSYPAIVKIDMKTMEVTYIIDWVEEVERYIARGDDCGYFSDGYVINEESVLLPLGCMGGVLQLDLSSDSTKLIELNISMKGIGGISSLDGKNIWMVGKGNITNRVVCWNWVTGKINEMVLEDMKENIPIPFYAPICTKKRVFLMPVSASCIYEIDPSTKTIQKSKIVERPFRDPVNSVLSYWRTMAARLKGNWLSFLICDDCSWQEYNVETGESRYYFISLEEDEKTEKYFETLLLKGIEEKRQISEMKLPLKYYVCKSLEKKNICFGIDKQNRSLGKKIYDQICTDEK